MGAQIKDITADMGDAPEISEAQTEEIVEETSTTAEPELDKEASLGEEIVSEEGAESKEEIKPSEGPAEDDTSFFEKPGVKKRIEGIEQKYGSKAEYWDTISTIAQQDPEFRIVMAERLERAGKLPVGTAERMKGELQQVQQQTQNQSQDLNNLPPEIREDIKAVREFRQQQEAVKAQQEQEATNFFLDFEKDKPDIAQSVNPARTRSVIFNMASEMVDRGAEKDIATAMGKAYKIVLHSDELAAKAKEDGQVEAMVQANMEASSALTSGKGVPGKQAKLSQEERRAAELIGMTPEEYRKYKDTDDDDLFENI